MYGGLSGCLSGLFVYVALIRSREKSWLRYLYVGGLAMFTLKLGVEFSTGASVFVAVGDGVVVESAAHAIGAVTGVFGVLISSRLDAGIEVAPHALRVGNKKAVPEGTA
jgi:membrane associated rhomboid family serine protease